MIYHSYSGDEAYRFVKSFFEDACRLTQSPLSAKLLQLSREGRDEELCRLEFRHADYTEVDAFRNDYCLVSILSKWKGLRTGIDTKSVALKAFESQELVCKRINARLRQSDPSFVTPILHRAQRLIAKVLGEFSVDRVRDLGAWGPGATTDMSRGRAYLDAKITDLPIPVTIRARGALARTIQEDLHWSYCILGVFPEGEYSLLPNVFDVVQGSRIDVAPKSAKTDRTIAIEPRGNMFLQKAVGKIFRRLLKRVGVDLDDQTLNQKLAALCEELGLATIDLAMASDSVSLELVYKLLPIEWALYLDDLRSHWYQMSKTSPWVRFEKFSSMGNGFTFELESLIFWALSKASMEDEEGRLAIYGDDIIVPQSDADVVISTLAFAGFTTNDQKSFLCGHFFESCGKHYFKGIDVTPPYQKDELVDLPTTVRFVNRIARYLIRNACDDRISGPWAKPWENRVRELIRLPGTPCIPFGTEGDSGYLVNHRIAPPLRWKRSYGNQWNVIAANVKTIPGNGAALLADRLRHSGSSRSSFGHADIFRSQGGIVSRSETERSDDLASRETSSRYSITTKWIDPQWEFALD